MKSKLAKLFLAVAFTLVVSLPAIACTLPQNVGKNADTESIDQRFIAHMAKEINE